MSICCRCGRKKEKKEKNLKDSNHVHEEARKRRGLVWQLQACRRHASRSASERGFCVTSLAHRAPQHSEWGIQTQGPSACLQGEWEDTCQQLKQREGGADGEAKPGPENLGSLPALLLAGLVALGIGSALLAHTPVELVSAQSPPLGLA